jgi:hypothetical protein
MKKHQDTIDSKGRIPIIGLEGATCFTYVDPRTKELFIFSEGELIKYAGKDRRGQRNVFSNTNQTEIRDRKIKIARTQLEQAGLSNGDQIRPSYSSHYLSFEKVA